MGYDDPDRDRIYDIEVRRRAESALGPDKSRAWQDLVWLTQADAPYESKEAIDSLGIAFKYVSDNACAWQDLVRLDSG